jgi:hypothetical protein
VVGRAIAGRLSGGSQHFNVIDKYDRPLGKAQMLIALGCSQPQICLPF